MSLQKIGEFNNISPELLATVPPLAKGQKAVFRLLDYQINPDTGEKFFGGIRALRGKDTIKDLNGNIIDIGIPKTIESNKVVSCKKYVLNGGGPYGLVGEFFQLVGGNLADEQWYTFFMLCNYNASNSRRDKSVRAEFELVNQANEARKRSTRRSDLLKALTLFENMTQKQIIRFAAAQGWNETKDIDLLREDVGHYAQHYPDLFLKKASGGDEENIKATLKMAQTKGVITFDPVSFKYAWAENGSVIVKLERDGNKNELELFAEFIKTTKNGHNILEAIVSAYEAKMNVENHGEDAPAPVIKKRGGGKRQVEQAPKEEEEENAFGPEPVVQEVVEQENDPGSGFDL